MAAESAGFVVASGSLPPAISTPVTSSGRVHAESPGADSRVAKCWSGIVSTAAAPEPAATSRAMFGPARMPAGWPGSSSSMICDIRILVPCSSPLTRHHRHPRPQFLAQLGEHASETVRGHAHDDDVGAVGGLDEVGGGAQRVAQDDVIAEVAAVAVDGR
jgi:hypothetical protein